MIIRTENYAVRIKLKNVNNQIEVKAFARQSVEGHKLETSKLCEGATGCNYGIPLHIFFDSGAVRENNQHNQVTKSDCIAKLTFISAAECRFWFKSINLALISCERNRVIKDTEIRMLEEEFSVEA